MTERRGLWRGLPWDPGVAVPMRCQLRPVFEPDAGPRWQPAALDELHRLYRDLVQPTLERARPTAGVPPLLLLEEAVNAMTAPCPPLCDQQLPTEADPAGPGLRCDLPAGHHSQEHYDRATGTVWLPPGVSPPHADTATGDPNAPWPHRT